MRNFAFVFMLLLSFLQPLHATVYFVRTDGKDANTGTTNAANGAWRTLKAAASKLTGGDTVLVADGDYYEDEIKFTNYSLNKKETPILFKSATKHGAKIISTSKYHAINLTNSVAITIDGFDITFQKATTSEYHGINLEGNWQTIRNCKIHGAPFSGIQGYLCDNLLIEKNILYDNCKGTGKTVHENGSGISVYHPIAREAGDGFHIIIRNNMIYNNVAYNNVSSTGFPTDGNGIIMDDFHCGQNWDKDQTKLANYPNPSLVENNLIFNNGGRGVHVFSSDNVTLRNNTCYHNGWKLHDYSVDPGDLTVENGVNNTIINNIAVSRPDLKRGGAIRIANDKSTTQIKSNLIVGSKLISTWSSSVSLDKTNITSPNQIFAGFVYPSTDLLLADFRLKANSPAVDAATNSNYPSTDFEGKVRSMGGGVDMGCYEYDSSVIYPTATHGLTGSYYKGAGNNELLFIRNDAQVGFLAGEIKDFNEKRLTDFNVRWEGKIVPKYSEQYRFRIHTLLNGILKINGKTICSGWEGEGHIDMVADSAYDIQLTFDQSQRDDYAAVLMWDSPSQSGEVVPEEALIPQDPTAMYVPKVAYPLDGIHGLKMEVFTDAALTKRVMAKVVPNVRLIPGELNELRNTYGEKLYVRWMGKIVAPLTSTYKFVTWTIFNSSLFIDGKILGNGWEYHAEMDLKAGKSYNIEFKFETNENFDASARLFWEAKGLTHELIQPKYFLPAQDGITSEYFSNSNFTGTTVKRNEFQPLFLSGELKNLDSLGLDDFSVRMKARITPLYTENYKFNCLTNTDMKATIDGKKVCDAVSTGQMLLTKGKNYNLEVEYNNNSGNKDYMAVLLWSNSKQAMEPIPSLALKIDDTLAYAVTTVPLPNLPKNGLVGEYLSSGTTAVKRVDKNIRFIPGDFAKITTLSTGPINTIWKGKIGVPQSSTYTFSFSTNAKASLKINGKIVIADDQTSGKIALEKGERYEIELVFSTTDLSNAHLLLFWEHPNLNKQIVPFNYLFQPEGITSLNGFETMDVTLCYPNPFSESVRLTVDPSNAMSIKATIYNSLGVKVNELKKEANQGSTFLEWNGKDNQDVPVEKGLYLIQMEAGGHKYYKATVIKK